VCVNLKQEDVEVETQVVKVGGHTRTHAHTLTRTHAHLEQKDIEVETQVVEVGEHTHTHTHTHTHLEQKDVEIEAQVVEVRGPVEPGPPHLEREGGGRLLNGIR
jgi:hypothetical protein